MNIPAHIDERIDMMEECEKKEAWEKLKKTDNVYVVIPTIDGLNYKYDCLQSNIKMYTLQSLKFSSPYYHKVNEIYQKYDFILDKGFFDANIHQNEYDTVYVTEKTRETANKICRDIDERIEELSKKKNNI
ncbi:hypothetical protein [Methanobrevibacter sp.]|uniref:hypothetical protein n=1 Tax=Methanobrevibacter sp. TaxID=66852 RepID=UPI0025F87005|nr:hypothetical protein [Methanobrevibacter sp.]MBQ2831802.1 hypothetical protein [Methanobrevibacter sp.]